MGNSASASKLTGGASGQLGAARRGISDTIDDTSGYDGKADDIAEVYDDSAEAPAVTFPVVAQPGAHHPHFFCKNANDYKASRLQATG